MRFETALKIKFKFNGNITERVFNLEIIEMCIEPNKLKESILNEAKL